MKIALVHDWLVHLGGAERVLIALHKIFPEAPIHTLFYDKKFASEHLPRAEIISSFLQKIPNIKKIHPWFKILMPSAVESLNFQNSGLVISSSHEFSHGILAKQNSRHICYYHSPSRILWDRTHEYAQDFKKRGRGGIKISLIKLGQHFLRLWDWPASQRPDIIVANSKHVAERIKKYYGREAKVIYPPVEKPLGYSHFGNARPRISYLPLLSSVPPGPSLLARLAKRISPLNGSAREVPQWLYPAGFSPYFLIVSQLYPHKNIDLAIEAFKKLNLNLLIIGEGPEKRRLQKLIGDSASIKLLGFVSDEELPHYYQNCLAYFICNEEDFGISPIEAMSFGKPVLAYRKGGAAETVLENATGEFFDKLEPDEIAQALESISRKIKNDCYDSAAIRKHSEKFSFERFKKEVLDIVKDLEYNFNYET